MNSTASSIISEASDKKIRAWFDGMSEAALKKYCPAFEKLVKKVQGEMRQFSSFKIDDVEEACATFGLELVRGRVRSLDRKAFNATDLYNLETVARCHKLVLKKVNMKYEVSLRMMVDPLVTAASYSSESVLFPEHKIKGGRVTVEGVEVFVNGAADYVAAEVRERVDNPDQLRMMRRRGTLHPKAPLFHLLEVKRELDLETGIGQLTAELEAAFSTLVERGKDEAPRAINAMLTNGLLYYVMRMEEQASPSAKRRLLWCDEPLSIMEDGKGTDHVYQLLQTCLAGGNPFLEEVPAKKEPKVVDSYVTPSGKHRVTTTLVTPMTNTQPTAAAEKVVPPPYGKRAVPGSTPIKSPLKKKPCVDGDEASNESDEHEDIDISSSSDEEKPVTTRLFVDPPTPPSPPTPPLPSTPPPVDNEVLSDPSPVRPPPRRFLRRHVTRPIIYSPSKFEGGKRGRKESNL